MLNERYYTTIDGKPLLPYYQISIRDGEEAKYIKFHSTIHRNKVKDVSFCYSHEFSDHSILMDSSLVTLFYDCYGVDVFKYAKIH